MNVALPEPRSSALVVASVEAVTHQALIQYLKGRCIDIGIARRYLRQVRYHRS